MIKTTLRTYRTNTSVGMSHPKRNEDYRVLHENIKENKDLEICTPKSLQDKRVETKWQRMIRESRDKSSLKETLPKGSGGKGHNRGSYNMKEVASWIMGHHIVGKQTEREGTLTKTFCPSTIEQVTIYRSRMVSWTGFGPQSFIKYFLILRYRTKFSETSLPNV